MSRLAFFKIISTDRDEDEHEDLEDIRGYALFDWGAHGVVGYDDELQTYFANLDGSWGIGTTYREIPTVGALQRRLSEIFHGAELPFLGDGLLLLATGVEDEPLILTSSEAVARK